MMTTEEKAQAYDDALKIARDYHEDKNCFKYLKGVLENIFPEITKSEDEKIRKVIRGWIYTQPTSFFDNGISKEEMLAWLEKQGKQKNSYKITFEDVLALECAMKTVKRTEGGNELYEMLVSLYNKIYNVYLVEKQDAQKETLCDKCKKEQPSHSCQDITALGRCYIDSMNTANKIEPKFKVGDTMRTLQEANDGYTDGMPVIVSIDNEYYHCTNELIAIKDQDDYEFPPINVKQKHNDKPKFKVGDWIVKKNIAYHIDKISGVYLTLSTINGTALVYHKSVLDNDKIHLWTIEDAKDGDVLVHNSVTFIFKGIEDGIVKGLCSELGDFISNFGQPKYDKDYSPATKEQRDLLFAKMREASYEWDSEKKEVKLTKIN